ncbi:hypothetical protein [Novosphingobium sp.]|uniref:hypothetical protein n=1 Tax=Novosphingobium sp. TaxID=1874826 RepID=UPI003B52B723
MLSLTDAIAGEPSGGAGLRGYLTIGGRSLARHQLGLALALGCTRIIVVTEALTGEVIALQHATEAGGARFHVIAQPHALLPLITAEDELFVMADGLLVLPEAALARLEEGPGVLALPVEAGTAAGFERIDINHAFAGMIRMPGRLVAGLGELPPEWNAHAALLRLAVQGRVPLRLLPEALLGDGRWVIVRNEDEAHAAEPVWLRLHTQSAHVRSPGEWIAGQLVHSAGPALLHAGTRPWVVAMGGVVALLLAVGSGWFGWPTAGFVLLALAWVLVRVAALMTRIERQSLLETGKTPPTGLIFELAIDAAFVLLAIWRSDLALVPGVPFGVSWFPPVIFILLLHFTPRVMPQGRWAWWLRDRLVTGLGFAVVSAVLPFDYCLRAVILALVVWAMVVTPEHGGSANPGLTTRE